VTDLHRNLIRNLKRRRASLGISQMELAEKADLSSGYVGEIEMGRKFPAPEALERLALALDTKPWRLLMGDDDAAEWNGAEAFYAAADEIRERLNKEIDSLMKRQGGLPPQEGKTEAPGG
jgi:transcriptional regulator with XRE-family HTH domain